jgi:hypothetical protein
MRGGHQTVKHSVGQKHRPAMKNGGGNPPHLGWRLAAWEAPPKRGLPLSAETDQYVGKVGSTSWLQASSPPRSDFTRLYPRERRNRTVSALRPPILQ